MPGTVGKSSDVAPFRAGELSSRDQAFTAATRFAHRISVVPLRNASTMTRVDDRTEGPGWSRLGPQGVPFTYAVVISLVLVSVFLHTHADSINDVVAWSSTNVHNLIRHPITATLASAFVVPDGLFPDLLIVAVTFALLERSIGTARTVLIALTGHALATLLTEGGVGVAVSRHWLPDVDLVRSDVGISYAMFSVVGACVLLATRPKAVRGRGRRAGRRACARPRRPRHDRRRSSAVGGDRLRPDAAPSE